MATNIPPHNLREVAAAVIWCLDNPDADDEETLDALMERIKGPDFPTAALIVGRGRHRGRVPHRPRLDPDARGRRRRGGRARAAPSWSSPSCPTRSTRTTWPSRSPSWSRRAARRHRRHRATSPSDRIGMRLVITLKRDAVAKVVLNNLYKHTQLQTTFGANMLALVDGVPRTLRSTSSSATTSRTRSRSSSGAPSTGCARPRSGRTSCAAWSRRSTRSTRSSR